LEPIENLNEWRSSYSEWQRKAGAVRDDLPASYPWVENKRAPFSPARRALPMLNLAVISAAGAYIDGTQAFDTTTTDGDLTLREIPIEVDAEDLRYSSRGYDPTDVQQDMNALIPVRRLMEFESNGIIGQLNSVFWSFSGFAPNAAMLVEELIPKVLHRVNRYEVQAALLVPASRLCHQSVSLIARAIESTGIPTMTLAVDKEVVEYVRPPRAALYDGKTGAVAGLPNWPEHQRRVLDEALRLIEPMAQAGVRRLTVALESQVEKARGER
jgi:D-proline reductase (dithiol) PrdB